MDSHTHQDVLAILAVGGNLAAARLWVMVTRGLLRLLWVADRIVCYLVPARALRARLQRYRKVDRDLHSLAALLQMSVRDIPPTGNCAGSSDFLLLIARTILSERPAVIVEFGSGVSSFVIARCLEINRAGRLISFDHSPSFAEITRFQLERRQLRADIRVVPLRSADGGQYHGLWYDADELPEGIDLIIVDGPPASLHPETRGGAGPATFARLREGGVVMLDDACRPGERKIVSRWRRDYPEIDFILFNTMKGTVVGRKGRPAQALAVPSVHRAQRPATASLGAEQGVLAG